MIKIHSKHQLITNSLIFNKRRFSLNNILKSNQISKTFENKEENIKLIEFPKKINIKNEKLNLISNSMINLRNNPKFEDNNFLKIGRAHV